MLKTFLTIFLFISTLLYANAGSPLLWTKFFHLLVGNFIIGVIEAFIIICILKLKKLIKIIFIVVIANYFSMILGVVLLSYIKSFFYIEIHNLYIFFYVFIILSFVFTIILELPFILFLLKNNKSSLINKMIVFLFANLITYLLITILYFYNSNLTIITDYKLRKLTQDEINYLDKLNIYFIPIGKKNYYKYDLSNNRTIKIESRSKLNILKEKKKKIFEDSYSYSQVNTLVNNYDNWDIRKYGTFTKYIYYSQKKMNYHGTIGYETPYFSYSLIFVSYIGNDYLIFEFNKQIFVLNMKKKELILLVSGNFPIIELK